MIMHVVYCTLDRYIFGMLCYDIFLFLLIKKICMQKNVLLSNNLTKKKAVINMKKKLHASNKIQYLLSSNFNWNFLEMFLNKPIEMYILIDAILLDQELQYQATQLYNWSVEHRWCGDHFYFCDGNRPALPPLWLHLGGCPLCHGSQLSHLFL